MKVFECIIDDNKDVYKVRSCYDSKKELLNECGGNGDFISIKDVSKEYEFDVDSILQILSENNVNEIEMELLMNFMNKFNNKNK